MSKSVFEHTAVTGRSPRQHGAQGVGLGRAVLGARRVVAHWAADAQARELHRGYDERSAGVGLIQDA